MSCSKSKSVFLSDIPILYCAALARLTVRDVLFNASQGLMPRNDKLRTVYLETSESNAAAPRWNLNTVGSMCALTVIISEAEAPIDSFDTPCQAGRNIFSNGLAHQMSPDDRVRLVLFIFVDLVPHPKHCLQRIRDHEVSRVGRRRFSAARRRSCHARNDRYPGRIALPGKSRYDQACP